MDGQSMGVVWRSAFDALRVTNPDTAERLAKDFPRWQDEILGLSKLGPSTARERPQSTDTQRADLGREAVEDVLSALTQSLDEVLQLLTQKASSLARARLVSSIVSLLGSSGMIAAIPFAVAAAVASAAVTFIAAAITLVVTYRESASGGDGSIAKLRESMIAQLGILAEVRGQLRLGVALQKDVDVESAMTNLNAVAQATMMVRAQLGLRIS